MLAYPMVFSKSGGGREGDAAYLAVHRLHLKLENTQWAAHLRGFQKENNAETTRPLLHDWLFESIP